MNDAFASSDASRTADPLIHARTVRFKGPLHMVREGSLPHVDVTYETYGSLNAQRDNAVLVCHALTGDSHVARHDDGDAPGWWDIVVGPGKAIDTDRFFVICSNVLGSCRGTTGPNSVNPATGLPYGRDFPAVTVEDMVDVQARLIDHLGIDKLFAVVGGSLGGHQALAWATRYPDRVLACAVIAASPHLTAQALAFDVVGRNAILRDPHFHDGQYYDQDTKPDTGLALARMLGHITYLSPESMAIKFDADKFQPRDVATEFEKQFSVGSYLAYQGDKFVERFDANSYITISTAMDRFELGRSPGSLARALGASNCRWLVLSFTSDWLFPAFQSRQIVDALIATRQYVSYCNVQSDAGHDAFLLPNDLDAYGQMLKAFLESTTPDATFSPLSPEDDDPSCAVLHHDRIDYDRMLPLIEPGSSVLDLGCGRGGLLTRLAHEHGADRLVGVELDEQNILATLQRGFDIIQADLNEGLPEFGDNEFDYVVLSQTLQSIIRTEAVVDEIVRVGRRAIVSFPNFAYKKIRDALAVDGRSPGTDGGQLPYAWYNTPNRRFLSVLDWREFCAERDLTIHDAVYLNTEESRTVVDNPNLNADLAIFVISR